MSEIRKCEYCGKPMTYNKILEKYECDDPACWIKRIPLEALNKIDYVGPSIPAASCNGNLSPLNIISGIGTATLKSTYNVFRAIGKTFKKSK